MAFVAQATAISSKALLTIQLDVKGVALLCVTLDHAVFSMTSRFPV